MSGPSIPSGFIAIFVIFAIIGVGSAIYRMSLARRIARGAGLNENDAAATTFLTPNGLDATYLAASLHGRAQAAAGAAGRSTEDRLRELQGLRDSGLVTAQEYDARRTAILDQV
jgi:hypothetical protein